MKIIPPVRDALLVGVPLATAIIVTVLFAPEAEALHRDGPVYTAPKISYSKVCVTGKNLDLSQFGPGMPQGTMTIAPELIPTLEQLGIQ